MANPVHSLNENFVYNSMLARALIQLLPSSDKPVIRLWLEKLHTIDGNPDEMNTRNEYMWFLLLMLQNKKITLPFNLAPPPKALRPLREILPTEIYEEVLMATDQTMSFMEQSQSSCAHIPIDVDLTATKATIPQCRPAQFFHNQPVPQDGIICYMAAFSDHDH